MARKFLNHFTLRPNSDFMLLFVTLYSTHHEGETFPKNYRLQLNNSLAKWQKSFLIISHCVLTVTL